jgi:Fic family protein
MSHEYDADGWKEFTHDGQRWSFDADSLAVWDEEEDHFEFYLHHELTNPTVETVIQFIEETKARVAAAINQPQ